MELILVVSDRLLLWIEGHLVGALMRLRVLYDVRGGGWQVIGDYWLILCSADVSATFVTRLSFLDVVH